MEGIIPYLQEQILLHPGMQPRDIIKLCYQAAYGGDHLLLDVTKAEDSFNQEYQTVQPREESLYEIISPEMVRVNLRAWKQAGMPGVWLFRLFTLSAQMSAPGNLETYFNEAEQLNFPGFHDFRVAYEREGMGSVHHSEKYRQVEQPAYRVVQRKLLPLISILEKAAFVQGEEPHVLAIDGRAASGKTTMAQELSFILAAPVIAMDDFFLPMALRTQERYDEAGGNVHYERFMEEVLPYIRSKNSFSYRRFDCSQMDYSPEYCAVPPSGGWRIVEGSYSLHPAFGPYADLTVFASVDRDEQARRILARNGAEFAQIFREKWIPLEEKYFSSYPIEQTAHIRCG